MTNMSQDRSLKRGGTETLYGDARYIAGGFVWIFSSSSVENGRGNFLIKKMCTYIYSCHLLWGRILGVL